ncbi:hypothetical protein GCK32_011965 [Trichostrongylus colubriformis]|uniref:Uncharacterized protein n=1 Tax=Trichostrongylus colubriformis TaxID=6319 RepID=A0AAN8FVI4_TRICO
MRLLLLIATLTAPVTPFEWGLFPACCCGSVWYDLLMALTLCPKPKPLQPLPPAPAAAEAATNVILPPAPSGPVPPAPIALPPPGYPVPLSQPPLQPVNLPAPGPVPLPTYAMAGR